MGPLLAICGALPAGAATFYVRASCAVSPDQCAPGDGATPATAFGTIGAAASALRNAGDEVVVGPGVYAEVNITPVRGGVLGRPITFRADPTGSLTGDAPGEVDVTAPAMTPGLTGFLILGKSYVVIDGFTLEGFSDPAIQVRAEAGGGLNSSFVTIRNNVIRNCVKTGIEVFAVGPVEISGNEVVHNGNSGIVVQGCVSADPRCQTGSAGSVTPSITGNVSGSNGLGDGGHGIFVAEANGGTIQNNILFSNQISGCTLRTTSDITVINNLSYANVEDGFAIGTAEVSADRTRLVNNTSYGNGGWGVVVGEGPTGSVGTISLNNIIQGNTKGGITVSRPASCGYVSGFNHNHDGHPLDTPDTPYDSFEAVKFVDPAGADGRLGGDDFRDDDFHLVQGVGGARNASPGVDDGAGLVSDFGLTGSTAVSGLPDRGRIDAGFHYGARPDQMVTVHVPLMPIYVRSSGDDGNDGMSPDRALATITRAAAELAFAGVTVVVGPGVYREGLIGVGKQSGRVSFVGDASGLMTGDLPAPVLVDAGGQDTGFVLLDACGVTVSGFHVTGGVSAGIQVRAGSPDARIDDNVVFGNQRRGIEVRDTDRAEVSNNLVYANGTGGVRISASAGSSVRNNTVYGNGEDGILVDGAATATTVVRNATERNGTGVTVKPDSENGYVTEFNVVAEGFIGHAPRGASDTVASPLFTRPSGVDGVLAGANFADDDFHLQQDAAATSPAVDIDTAAVNELANGSTRSDGLPDLGPADAGFHDPVSTVSRLRGAPPQVVYVRAVGSDANDGTSPQRAYATVGRALKNLAGDAMIVVGPGRYAETSLDIGGASRFLSLIGDSSGALTGDAPGLVFFDAAARAPRVVGPALLRGIVLAGSRGTGLLVDRRAADVTLRDAVVCGNARTGILAFNDGFNLMNSLVSGNGGNGVSLRLRNAGRGMRVINSSVVENLRHGVLLREYASNSPHLRLYNNVIDGNGSTGVTGRGLAGGNNLNTDGYGSRLRPGPGDIDQPPQFVAGPASPAFGCESLNDFKVSLSSPAIDAGNGAAVNFDLAARSATVLDGDTGTVDLGYHYDGAPLAVPTRTPTKTPSRTATATRTRTFTVTATRSVTATPSSTGTPTRTFTASARPTATPTATATSTRTATETSSPTPSETPTFTPTSTAPATDTPTPTATETPTPSAEPTDTETPTASATATETATDSPTPVPTQTPTETATATGTGTETPTATPSHTPTRTATETPTITATPTATPTATRTASATSTPADTATETPTRTATATETVSATLTATATQTATATLTATVSDTATATETPTSTETETPTPTTGP